MGATTNETEQVLAQVDEALRCLAEADERVRSAETCIVYNRTWSAIKLVRQAHDDIKRARECLRNGAR